MRRESKPENTNTNAGGDGSSEMRAVSGRENWLIHRRSMRIRRLSRKALLEERDEENGGQETEREREREE